MQNKEIIYLSVIALIWLLASYLLFFLFDNNTMQWITKEDGIYETAGALFFLATSLLFFYLYYSDSERNRIFNLKTKKNIFLLLLGILFFIAVGEEISWGQRLLGIDTPGVFNEANRQNELNIHNLSFLHIKTKTGELNIHTLFLLFWLFFCLIIPILNKTSSKISKILQKINLPIVPIWIGLLFVLNTLLARLVIYSNLDNIHRSLSEIKESNYALLFLIVAIFFVLDKRNKTRFEKK